MSAKLGSSNAPGESNSAFIGLVGAVAQALQGSDMVTSISYAEQHQELNVEVLLQSYDQIDTLKEYLEKSGLAMDTTNAEQEGTRVRSRIRVRYAG